MARDTQHTRIVNVFRYDPTKQDEGRFDRFEIDIEDDTLTTILDVLLKESCTRERMATVDETKVVATLLKSTEGTEGTMVDVGALGGNSASHFLALGWKVICFEPDPANREKLVQRFGKTPQVVIDPRALGEKPEKDVPFFSSPESPGISGLHAFHETHRQTALVDVSTVADIVRHYGIDRIDFLKIDVEGFDLAVLRGVPWDLHKPRVIECEFEDAKTESLGHCSRDIADFLAAKGYSV